MVFAAATTRVAQASTSSRGNVVLASTAQTQAGADTSRAITPAGLKGALGFSNFYVSSDVSIVLGSTLSFTHGLAIVPVKVLTTLVCVTADRGYAVGEEVELPSEISNITDGITTSRNGTIIHVTVSTNSFGFYVKRKDAPVGGLASLTPANWQIRVRAWG
jgi:hypothetical protein